MSEKETTSEKPRRRKIIEAIATLIVLLVIGLTLAKWVFQVTWGNIFAFSTFLAFIFLLVFLKRRYKRAEQVIEGAFKWNLLLLFWWFLTFGPTILFYQLSPLILNNRTIWFQVSVFVIWGLLLIFGSLAGLIERYREPFLRWLQSRIGKFAPCAYGFNLLVIAILFFSSVTFVLVDHGALRLNSPTGAKISPEAIRDFYAWHFFQSIPFLKVTETLRWREPLTYDSGWIGFVLLVFQLMVIIPVTAAFAWYWKHLEAAHGNKVSGAPWKYPFTS